jgi:hypothetical protein
MSEDDKKSISGLFGKLASSIEENKNLQEKVVGLENIRNEQQTEIDSIKA